MHEVNDTSANVARPVLVETWRATHTFNALLDVSDDDVWILNLLAQRVRPKQLESIVCPIHNRFGRGFDGTLHTL